MKQDIKNQSVGNSDIYSEISSKIEDITERYVCTGNTYIKVDIYITSEERKELQIKDKIREHISNIIKKLNIKLNGFDVKFFFGEKHLISPAIIEIHK